MSHLQYIYNFNLPGYTICITITDLPVITTFVYIFITALDLDPVFPNSPQKANVEILLLTVTHKHT